MKIILLVTATAKSLQTCPTLCDPMDCSLPGFSIHGIFQARVLEWVVIAFSTKGTFHAKMGSRQDRNCMDLKEAEDIKKRWQEYTEELYKKDLHDPDITKV